MEEKKDLSIEALRRKVCDRCRSKVSCRERGDERVINCPIVNTYKSNGTIFYPMDDWYRNN